MIQERRAAVELDKTSTVFEARIVPILRASLVAWMRGIDARGGPSVATLVAPVYGAPDPALVRQVERLLIASYVLGMDHASPSIALADDDYTKVPFEEAVRYMRSRIPLAKDEWKALEEQLRFRAFTLAALSEPDAIERVRQHAIQAVGEGKTFVEFWTAGAAEGAAGLGASPWYWETVYRTNVQTAYNAGRVAELMRSQSEYLTLIGINDVRQTVICASLTDPPIVLPASHPFWQSHIPPFHFNCRTTIRAVFQEEIDALRTANPGWDITQNSRLEITELPADGFGGNPVVTGSFYKLTPSMIERAQKYGILDDIKIFAKSVGLKNYRLRVPKVSAATKTAAAASASIGPSQSVQATSSKTVGEVPAFKTVREAESWIVENNLAGAVSFKDCDLRVVQDWTVALRQATVENPDIRKALRFVGTIQERNRALADDLEERIYAWLVASGVDDTLARKFALGEKNTLITQLRVPADTIAEFYSFEGFGGITVNQKYAVSYDEFLRVRQRDVAAGWKPVGTEAVVGTLEHEMGHLLDHIYGLSKSPELLSYHKALTNAEIAAGLSQYACKNVQEFVAEAWCEYRLSASPREIARTVANLLLARKGGLK